MWVDVFCWIDCVWFSKECACCDCDPSVHLSVPSIGFVYVFCMFEIISSFKDLMRSKNTSGYFTFYVNNISIKTYST